MDLNPPDDHVASRMRTQATAGTSPEMKLRKTLFARGMRYRIGLKVPGANRRTIDIAFPRHRLAIFVDGCFWHRCPKHSTTVKNNAKWWAKKLAENVARDGSTNALLESQGWTVLRFWEHEDPEEAVEKVISTLASLE